tara:strand:+ start:37797 stop:38150 length:354 start_codon:yes stop_codon:yes gene_type:complete
MDILLGVGTLAVTALIFAWGFAAHRRSKPAGWTRMPGGSMLFCVAMTLALPIGIGFLIKAVAAPSAQLAGLGLAPVAVVAALVALAILGVPMMLRSVRADQVAQVVTLPDAGGATPA